MCAEAWIDGTRITTQGDLIRAVGGKRNVVLIDVAGRSTLSNKYADSCLCGVNLKATAKKAGFTIERDDAWDWVLHRTAPKSP